MKSEFQVKKLYMRQENRTRTDKTATLPRCYKNNLKLSFPTSI